MPRIGPIYCETPSAIPYPFPAELLNTISNFPTILLGVLAFVIVWRTLPRTWELYILSFLLLATGIGSTLWHSLREGWALSFDVFPGIFFLLFFTFCWSALVAGRLVGLLVPLTLLGIQALAFSTLSFDGTISPFIVLYGSVLTFGLLLLWGTWHRYRGRATLLGLGAILLALFAATMRTIDFFACAYIPFGTHLLWHITLGASAFTAIMLILHIKRLQKNEKISERT